MNDYPRPVMTIKQIELTSRCNLACKYCPQPKMKRAKMDMDDETFALALEWVRAFIAQGTQGELSLTGLGEATIHPKFLEYVREARKALGPGRTLLLSTNGIELDDAMARELAKERCGVYVSTHRPERAGLAVNAAKRAGIFIDTNTSFVTSALNWAGQVEWENTAPSIYCEFLNQGWGVVLSDGRITTCCFDAEGLGVVGHVKDLELAGMQPYELCNTCHMKIPHARENAA